MTNWKLIKESAELAHFFLAQEGIYLAYDVVEQRVLNWYNHTDFTTVELLVAAAYTGPYDRRFSLTAIESCKAMLFPTIPYEYTEIHVYELGGIM